jgi:dipeptidyl aminopeptidase/acylaminoacyl peptidase
VIAPVPVQLVRRPARDRTEPPFPMHKPGWVLFAVVVAVAIGAGILYKTYFEETRTASDALPPPVPLTSYPGFQWSPSFSPDGNRVAFTWEEPGKRPPSVYVKLIGPTDPVRLTYSQESDFAPAWSPDGRWIAFLRHAVKFYPIEYPSAGVCPYVLTVAASIAIMCSGHHVDSAGLSHSRTAGPVFAFRHIPHGNAADKNLTPVTRTRIRAKFRII